MDPPLEDDLPGPHDLAQMEDGLSDADFQEVRDALGENYIERLLAMHLPEDPTHRPQARPGRSPLAGSMHRSEGDGELTDKAREEMERKVRELEAQDDQQEKPGEQTPP